MNARQLTHALSSGLIGESPAVFREAVLGAPSHLFRRLFLKPRKTFTRSRLQGCRSGRSAESLVIFFLAHMHAACSCEMALAEVSTVRARARADARTHSLCVSARERAAVTPAAKRIPSTHRERAFSRDTVD